MTDRRVNACRHSWDYQAKVCSRCGLTLHRYHASKPKRQARSEHRARAARWEKYLRQKDAEAE